ncbi:conserved hypothetical protein [Candidatus Koribacter versatilis Ellin345]|uniref:DoxX n=1 Tax=Koribacter versatilis (strain Ellin345) TaxID=204669 RepID=Q1IPI6_KORVE|nr:DoxX family protein [Candidatus Koribacter versatilis]ABF41214.1 conserved hypothetical protein [Candidatus Koribacter versatilis Ellin345]
MAAITTNFSIPATSTSKAALWTGRVLSSVAILFLLFDGLMKVILEPHVVAASGPLGFDPPTIVRIGAILLVCTTLYAIPRTSVLGAMLLTGYLGGAVVTNLRVHSVAFNTIFPVIFGIVVWAGVYLRNQRVRALFT